MAIPFYLYIRYKISCRYLIRDVLLHICPLKGKYLKGTSNCSVVFLGDDTRVFADVTGNTAVSITCGRHTDVFVAYIVPEGISTL